MNHLLTDVKYYIRNKDPVNKLWWVGSLEGGVIDLYPKLSDTDALLNKWRVWKVLHSAGGNPAVLHYGDIVFVTYINERFIGTASLEYSTTSCFARILYGGSEGMLARTMICSNTTYCKLDYTCTCSLDPYSPGCDCQHLVKGADYGKPVCLGQSVMFCIMPRDACSVYLFYDRSLDKNPNLVPALRVTDSYPGCASGWCPTSFELIPALLFTCVAGTETFFTDYDALEFNCDACGACYSGNQYISQRPINDCTRLPAKPALKYYTCCSKNYTCIEAPAGMALDVCQKRCVKGAPFACKAGSCLVDPMGDKADDTCDRACPTQANLCDQPSAPPHKRSKTALYASIGAVSGAILLAVVVTAAVLLSRKNTAANRKQTPARRPTTDKLA